MASAKVSNHTQINLNLPNLLLEEVDNYRFAERYPSRTAALTALIQKGLETTKRRKSNSTAASSND